jgi:hypothetical protein
LIAGLSVLLLFKDLSFWVNVFFLVALVMFIYGIGYSLFHISLHSRILLLLEEENIGIQLVPNLIENEEKCKDALIRYIRRSQGCYENQILFLFLGIFFCALAIIIHLCKYSYYAFFVIVTFIVLIFVSLFFLKLFARKGISNGLDARIK